MTTAILPINSPPQPSPSVSSISKKIVPTPDLNKLEKIQLFFADIRRRIEYERIARITPIISFSGNALFQTANLVNHVATIIPRSEGQGTPLLSSVSPGAIKIAGGSKIAGGAIVGVAAIYNIAAEIIEICDEVKKGRTWEGVDAGLRLTEAIGNLGEAIATFGQGLAMVNSSIGAVSWAPPLAIAGAVLSAVTIPLNIRGIIRTKEILDKLNDTNETKSLNYLKDELLNAEKGDGDFFLKRHFEVINREKYGAQILHIINSDAANKSPAIPDDKKATAKTEMLGALKERLTDKIVSHKLAIAAAVIGLVAVLILFFPVLGPIGMACGLALLGASSAISLTKFILDYRSVARLEKKLDELCPFDKIPDNDLPKFAKPLRRHLAKQLNDEAREMQKTRMRARRVNATMTRKLSGLKANAQPAKIIAAVKN